MPQLIEYTNRFDRLVALAAELELPAASLREAVDALPSQRDALEAAARRVRDYHQHQKASSWSFVDADGNRLGQKITPLDRVGLYVPGGKAAYPSARADERDPGEGGRRSRADHGRAHARRCATRWRWWPPPSPASTACSRSAVRRRLAHWPTGRRPCHVSTRSSARAMPEDVAEAKRRVFGIVGIDMIAGPSEILILCDGSTIVTRGRNGSVLAGRTRRDGAGHPAVPRCRIHRTRARVDCATAAADAGARR